MVVPCFSLFERQLNAPLRRVVNEISTGRGFPDVCFKSAKWFHRGENCFFAAVFDDTIASFVPRTPRSSPLFAARCAAEPGPQRTPVLEAVPDAERHEECRTASGTRT